MPDPFGPDEADFFALVQLERRVDEQHLLAVLLVDFENEIMISRSDCGDSASSSTPGC